MPKLNTARTGIPVCPWCGKQDQDWWDGTEMQHDEDEETVECGWCEKSYTTRIHIDYSFTTIRRYILLRQDIDTTQERIRRLEAKSCTGDDVEMDAFELRSLRLHLGHCEREKKELQEKGEWDEMAGS